MRKSRVVRLLGPTELHHDPLHDPEFELCAVVDPRQAEHFTTLGSLPVYRDLLAALRHTRASTVIYGNAYIDINGCAALNLGQRP